MPRFTASLVCAAGLLAVSVASQSTTVLFVGGGATATSGADGAILSYLENRYAAANVTYVSSSGLTSETILGYDVVVLSATPLSNQYRGVVNLSQAPIVNLEEAMAADVPGQFAVTERLKLSETNPQIIIPPTGHPITAGLPVNTPLPLFTGSSLMWWSTAPSAPSASVLATQSGGGGSANGFMAIVDQGGTLMNGAPAACRRVMFGMDNATFAQLSPEGLQLFGQAVDWAAGACCAQSSNYGAGLMGTDSVPTIGFDVPPAFLTTATLQVSSSINSGTAGAMVVGPTAANLPVLGGSLLAGPVVVYGIAVPPSGYALPIRIPDRASLCAGGSRAGLRLYLQAVLVDPGAVQGLSFTPGLRAQLGF